MKNLLADFEKYANEEQEKAYPILDKMKKFGLELNAQNNNGETMIMLFGKTIDICRTLGEAGADLNIQDNDGKTALMHMISEYPNTWVSESYRDCVEKSIDTLLDFGPDLNIQDNDGRTALMHAILTEWFSSSAMESLLYRFKKGGADLNIQDNDGKTALMHECEIMGDYADRYRFCNILEAGVDINLQDKDGETALMKLIQTRYGTSYIKDLLEYKPDITLTNKAGKTALDLFEKHLKKYLNDDACCQMRKALTTSPVKIPSEVTRLLKQLLPYPELLKKVLKEAIHMKQNQTPSQTKIASQKVKIPRKHGCKERQ